MQIPATHFDHDLARGGRYWAYCGGKATQMYARPCHAELLANRAELPVASCDCWHGFNGFVSQLLASLFEKPTETKAASQFAQFFAALRFPTDRTTLRFLVSLSLLTRTSQA
jgi:hypothetical protein